MTFGFQPLFITKPTDCLLDRLINWFAVISFAVITYPTQSYYEILINSNVAVVVVFLTLQPIVVVFYTAR